ncbi:MAG TPA: glucose-6-phosphate isomerase, partial [Gammaproteobacteria bacterium]|nr:glucose-6-phosphate isomerase [Gammaproteobacteria bacterium]
GDDNAVKQHFVAVSNNAAGAQAFGIVQNAIFPMPDWVGGRYSLWSAIGLPVILSYGPAVFDQLLRGAHAMDQHFCSAPWQENMPVLMALLDIWYSNFFGAQTQAIIPYRDSLHLLPAYLQQLCMESLGKQTTRAGQPSNVTTGNVIWGNVGTNGQHAFFQLLHQGSHLIPIDFILPLDNHTDNVRQHKMLLANCLAQSQALSEGCQEGDAPHRQFSGNRPSTTLVLDNLDGQGLGMLVALYEHKVFTQSVIWNINPFDQWGVELGKRLAQEVETKLQKEPTDSSPDSLTNYVRYKLTPRH